MTIAFTRTREQLAAMVLRKLGVLAAGGTANTNDLTVVYEAIDLRLKEMHRLGIFWHKVAKQPLSFTITANVASASASADVLFPISMHVGDNDEPVRLIGAREYADIQDLDRTGMPEVALHVGGSEFVFHPVPTTTTTAKLLYEKIADDTAMATAPDVEVSMMRHLRDMVCYDIGDDFNQSDQKMARLAQESMIAERNIRKLAVEKVDYAPVMVEDWPRSWRETDYGR